MTMRWSSGVLNTLAAPNLTEFRRAEIPDLTSRFPEAAHWLANSFLNSALRARYKPRVQQVVLGYLRRAHHGFVAYHDARQATLKYLEDDDPHRGAVRAYYGAVALWENFALQVAMAFHLYNWLSRPERAFEKNDGSPEQRLYSIANHIKHVGSCVDSGQCTEEDTLPLWLSNDGLQSYSTAVSFGEPAEILQDIASLADLLQDPVRRGVSCHRIRRMSGAV